MRKVFAPLLAALAASFAAGTLSSSCSGGDGGGADGGPDGGGVACAPRDAPASSTNAPRRFLTPAQIPLPAARAFSSSPLATHAGNATVALFPMENGVGLATAASSPFSGAQLFSDQADTPALATVGTRFFVGTRKGGLFTLGIADTAQGVVQLASGLGRTLQIPVPAGASTPANLALAASPPGAPAPALVAVFSAVSAGQTRVYAARLQNASCPSCTLAFDTPVEVSTNLPGSTFPAVAISRANALAVSFVRPLTSGVQLWVAQAQMGSGPISPRPVQLAEDAALARAPVAFYGDGSLAVVSGSVADPARPQQSSVVARRMTSSGAGAPVKVHDDDPALGATHWLPGAAVDIYDRLWVGWYDTRFASAGTAAWGPGPDDPARDGACTAVVMLARSDDLGVTFRPDALVTPDALTIPFDPVPRSFARARSPLGPVTVLATDTELLVGYTDGSRALLAEGNLP